MNELRTDCGCNVGCCALVAALLLLLYPPAQAKARGVDKLSPRNTGAFDKAPRRRQSPTRRFQDRVILPKTHRQVGNVLKRAKLRYAFSSGSGDPLSPSGDFTHGRTLKDGRVLLVVGDVMGHGEQAGKISNWSKGVLSRPFVVGRPESTLRYLDRVLSRSFKKHLPDGFVGASQLIVDPVRRTVTAQLAGLADLIIVRRDGSIETFGSTMAILGQDFNTKTNQPHLIKLSKGDRVVVVSDGITEAIQKDGRPIEWLVPHLQALSPGASPKKIARSIDRRVNKQWGDDHTALVFEMP